MSNWNLQRAYTRAFVVVGLGCRSMELIQKMAGIRLVSVNLTLSHLDAMVPFFALTPQGALSEPVSEEALPARSQPPPIPSILPGRTAGLFSFEIAAGFSWAERAFTSPSHRGRNANPSAVPRQAGN